MSFLDLRIPSALNSIPPVLILLPDPLLQLSLPVSKGF